ncbi:MAG TPA: alpha/beta hydrolase [Firmicutes bacterium]|jgi:pimeloyl-ACP methyl ester carboxylesterase|nr:alpha/beta hydrolase [Bacillota bacterium]
MNKKSQKLNFFEEYVPINGINQYLLHSTTNDHNPVLLFLHGGPGNAESLFAHVFQEKWQDILTVVHWDQRGAGKTLSKNPDAYPTMDLMLKDLLEIIQYLKEKYHQQKIILLGHSWGSVLGSIFIKKYPEEVAYYIGVGQVICMLENERVGYEKLKELIIKADDGKSLKKLAAVGDYPGERLEFDREFLKKCMKVRKLQGKYDLAIRWNFALFLNIFKSPIFKLSDIAAFLKGDKANEKVMEFLGAFDLRPESAEYEVPIYYILGGNDWQTPYIIAQEYFNQIKAPHKNLFLIPNAGHMTMMDQPYLFFEALADIHHKEGDKI